MHQLATAVFDTTGSGAVARSRTKTFHRVLALVRAAVVAAAVDISAEAVIETGCAAPGVVGCAT